MSEGSKKIETTEERRINIRVSEEEFKQLDQKRASMGLKWQDFRDVLLRWMDGSLQLFDKEEAGSNKKFAEKVQLDPGSFPESMLKSHDSGSSSAASSASTTLDPQEYEPWVALSRWVLMENNPHAAPSLKKNIESFAVLTELAGGKHAPPPGESIEARIARRLDAATSAIEALKNSLDKHGRPSRRRHKAA